MSNYGVAEDRLQQLSRHIAALAGRTPDPNNFAASGADKVLKRGCEGA